MKELEKYSTEFVDSQIKYLSEVLSGVHGNVDGRPDTRGMIAGVLRMYKLERYRRRVEARAKGVPMAVKEKYRLQGHKAVRQLGVPRELDSTRLPCIRQLVRIQYRGTVLQW